MSDYNDPVLEIQGLKKELKQLNAEMEKDVTDAVVIAGAEILLELESARKVIESYANTIMEFNEGGMARKWLEENK